MTKYDYDLFTIGAGSGGVRASRLAAGFNKKVGIAEEFRVGGTCVIRGCVPKKLMVYASEYGHGFHEAKGYGWSSENVNFNWDTLIKNKDAEIDRLNQIYIRNLNNVGVEIIQSRAVLKDTHTVHLVNENRDVTAEHILIATGGTPFVDTSIPGHELGITSNEVFHLDALPRRAVIAGGGYIAIEFACIMKGLGADVSLIYRGKDLLRYFDHDISNQVYDELVRLGIHVHTQSHIEKIEAFGNEPLGNNEKRVTLKDGTAIDCDMMMWAIGRNAYTENLGLEKAGVEIQKNGAIQVDDYSKTTADNIYAVGDVTNRVNLTPVAIREGAAFVETCFNNNPTKTDYTSIPKAVFSQPPVGSVGLGEHEAREQYKNIDIYKTDFRPMKNILADSDQRTLMKLIVDGDNDKVLGCHIVGEGAAEMIQMIAIAVKAGLTKAQFDDTVALHPTSAEELVTMKVKS